MTVVKKLDRYILKKFLLVFAGAFFICLFVFMMQFTWRYVDELIGKGLSMDILAQFFWYMGITLVPQALPLAVLLASLITFGNMGETLELLSMKAAGVPLIRVMAAPMAVAVTMAGVSFYFQNSTSPEAQINLRTLLLSMKQQSPAVEIPEGVFYNGVPNINIYVQQKQPETGMLYQLIIYKTDQGFDKAQIVLADSGRMEMTSDKLHLRLSMWSGEQFESLEGGGSQLSQSGAEAPYDRETFRHKDFLIDFDSNFALMDKDMLSGMPSAKNMREIEHSVDSMNTELDSIGRAYYAEARQTHFPLRFAARADSLRAERAAHASATPFDSLVARFPAQAMERAAHTAGNHAAQMENELSWKGTVTNDTEKYVRRHWVEWHQKITFSLACLIFFFVGAPLGAIIRKGGLGMPTVISVIIFIFWYIINTSGMKMARDGTIAMAWGMWVSTLVITPFGAFISYKANRDSVVFNTDLYAQLLRSVLGIRPKRHITRKEVIIDDPRLEAMPALLAALRDDCRRYCEEKHLLTAPGYADTFFRYKPDTEAEAISEKTEAIAEELSNSRDARVLTALNGFPIIYTTAHTSPFHSRKANIAAGMLLPLGAVLWLRMWRFRLLLLRDLRQTVRTCDRLTAVITGQTAAAEATDAREEARARRRKKLRKAAKWLLLALIALMLAEWGWRSWDGYRHRRAAQQTERVQ